MERVTSHLSTTTFMSADEGKSVKDVEEGKKEKEASSFIVSNPFCVIPAQIRFLSLPRGSDDETVTGTAESQRYFGQVEEAPMPEPFEWDPNAD